MPRRLTTTPTPKSRAHVRVEQGATAPRAMWLALCAIAFLVYLPAISNGFTYDDRTVISDANYLLSHLSLAPKLLSADYFALSGESTYRPMVTLSYLIDHTIGGGAPWVFHLDSVIWHVAAVALILALLLRLRAGRLAAASIALLFAIHPALTEAVDNVAFREDVLSTALGLTAVLLFMPGRGRISTGRSFAAAAILLLAELAKESAVVFVVLIPITLWFQASSETTTPRLREFVRAHRAALTGVAAAALAFFIVRFLVFPAPRGYGDYPGGSLWTGAATGLVAIGHYVRLLFVPAPLCADYRGVITPVTSLLDGRLWLGFAVIVAMLWLARFARQVAPLVTWGVATFVIGLAPVANLVPIPQPVAERFLYLPYIGGLTALVIGLQSSGRAVVRRVPRWTPLLALAVAACFLVPLTWRRHAVWKDNESLWTATLADHPTAYGAMQGLADVRLDQERFDDAEALLRRALNSPRIDDHQRAGILDELGITLGSAGRLEQAVPLFIASLKLGESAKAHYNLGVALVGLGRSEEGEAHLRRSIAINPYYAKPYPVLIELARRRGDVTEAARLQQEQPR